MSLEPLPFWLVNAFTTGSPHSGNQAGVVVFPPNDPRESDDEYKAKVSRDVDHAETAFLTPISEGKWGLRWWTPEVEVSLCGHATLASAHVLFSLHPDLNTLTFETRWAGTLRAERIENGENATKIKIFLPTFADDKLQEIINDTPSATQRLQIEAAKLLGVKEEDVVRVSPFEFAPKKSLIIQLASSVDIPSLQVDPKSLLPISSGMTIVTQTVPATSSPGKLSIRSRVFAPGFGVDEDPVTGSAHAYLAGYYLLTPASETIPADVAQGNVKSLAIVARQASARGGDLHCTLEEDGSVGIIGTACEFAKGQLTVW